MYVCECVCVRQTERERERDWYLDFRRVNFEKLIRYPSGVVQWAVGSLELWGRSSASK